MATSLSMTLSHDIASASPAWLGEVLRQSVFGPEGGFRIASLLEPAIPVFELDPAELAATTAHIDIEDLDGQTLHSGRYQVLADETTAGGWHVSGPTTITFLWWWNGDGTLEFILSDADGVVRHLRNSDCKKPGRWSDITRFTRPTA